MDRTVLKELLEEKHRVFGRISSILPELTRAAQEKRGDAVTSLTAELVSTRDAAHKLDERLNSFVTAAAAERGIPTEDFRLSMVDEAGDLRPRLDKLRSLVSEVARQAAQLSGVLAANIEIVQETIRVLESLDARAVGYSPEKPGVSTGPRPSKIFDRSV